MYIPMNINYYIQQFGQISLSSNFRLWSKRFCQDFIFIGIAEFDNIEIIGEGKVKTLGDGWCQMARQPFLWLHGLCIEVVTMNDIAISTCAKAFLIRLLLMYIKACLVFCFY